MCCKKLKKRFVFLKKLFEKNVKTVEFSGDNDTLFYKISIPDAEKENFDLIVPQTHSVLIMSNGVLSEELPVGTKEFRKNKTKTRLDIIFISKTKRVQSVWGTPLSQRVKYVDPKIGVPIDVGAFGKMEIKVADASKFYLEVVASFGKTFSLNDLQDFVRTKLISKITAVVRRTIENEKLSYYEFDHSLEKLQDELLPQLKNIFIADYGITVCDFIIENINITEENEKKIKDVYQKQQDRVVEINDYRAQRAFESELRDDAEADTKRYLRFKKEIAEDEDDLYNRDRTRTIAEEDRAIRIRREEEDRHWAHEDKAIDIDADVEKKSLYYDAVKAAGWNTPPSPDKGAKGELGNFCSKCGNPLSVSEMYCPVCGTPSRKNEEIVECPSCHKAVPVKNAFCPYCGNKM